MDYQSSGVNIELGDDASKILYEAAKFTWENRKGRLGAVVEMFGGFDREPKAEIHGVVHVTGGGIPGKLGRVLKPSGLGAEIDDPFIPPKIMLYCQELGNVKDVEAYKTWNMGQGMIVIKPNPGDVIRVAKKHGIESKVIGEVSSQQGIRINNKGFYSSQKILKF